MFRNKRIQILSTPREPEVIPEVLEVEEPVVTLEQPIQVIDEVVGIKSAVVETRYREFLLGSVIDYNGKEYDFEWDTKNWCLARLSGTDKVSTTTWMLTGNYLVKFLAPPVPPKLKEAPVTVPVIEKIVEAVVKEPEVKLPPIEDDVEKPIEIDLSDDDIFTRARQFLQSQNTSDVDNLDYLEL